MIEFLAYFAVILIFNKHHTVNLNIVKISVYKIVRIYNANSFSFPKLIDWAIGNTIA